MPFASAQSDPVEPRHPHGVTEPLSHTGQVGAIGSSPTGPVHERPVSMVGQFVLFQRPIEVIGPALASLGGVDDPNSSGPALFRTDLAFRETINRRGYDRAVCLKVRAPAPGSEFELMGDELEDTLNESVIDAGHGLLVATVTTELLRCLYFYCDHSGQTRVVERAEQASELGVVCSIEHRLDVNWEVYSQRLEPTPAEIRSGRGLDAMMALLAAGDDLDQTRPIGHFVFFPDAQRREGARMMAIKAGLDVAETLEPDEVDIHPGLVLVVDRSIDLELIDRDIEQIERVIAPLGGWHDGWVSLGETGPDGDKGDAGESEDNGSEDSEVKDD